MTIKLTCIECPQGCRLSVGEKDGKVTAVSGNKCPKGEVYAMSEVENPMRILTSTVLTENLPLRAVPVRTAGPIPKKTLFKAMEEIRKIRVTRLPGMGEVIRKDLAGTGVDLISTRGCADKD